MGFLNKNTPNGVLYSNGARDENRTHTSCDIRPSNVRVYQFRHLRIFKLLDYCKKNNDKRQVIFSLIFVKICIAIKKVYKNERNISRN